MTCSQYRHRPVACNALCGLHVVIKCDDEAPIPLIIPLHDLWVEELAPAVAAVCRCVLCLSCNLYVPT